MSPVFSHGRLRLYLLRLLEESPRHGYDVIRLLEDRFMGLYAPSPGTIYPRLQHLEAEGLVTQSQEGGRKVYRITDAGRQELARRHDELDGLEREISGSVHDLARELRGESRGTARDLREELKQAAREMRRQQRHENRSRRDRHEDRHRWEGNQGGWPDSGFEGCMREFLDRTDGLLRRVHLTETQLRECSAILDQAFERIRHTLKDSGDDKGGAPTRDDRR
jgi:DNA-binding PadR family transcriptional regulator